MCCGIFTKANAEHASYRQAIEFIQAGIWSYQQKIVTDIYQKQKQLFAYFFESQNTSSKNSLHVNKLTFI